MAEPQRDELTPAATNSPELLATSTARPRWQFSLWYLLLLMTVVAAAAGVVQYVSDAPGLAIGMLIYVLGFVAYMLLRLPWLMGKIWPERERLRENRRRLAEWADQKRKEKSEP